MRGYAHRLAWESKHGRIPAGMMVCHHCDTPSCVNPEHLFVGTAKDNAQDMIKKGRRVVASQTKPVPAVVSEIRSRRMHGERLSDLAQEFGLSTSMVSLIARNKRWKAA